MYTKVAQIRTSGKVDFKILNAIFLKLKKHFEFDWLLPLEIYELVYSSNTKLEENVLNHLLKLKENKRYIHLINNGLKLVLRNN